MCPDDYPSLEKDADWPSPGQLFTLDTSAVSREAV